MPPSISLWATTGEKLLMLDEFAEKVPESKPEKLNVPLWPLAVSVILRLS